VLYHIRGFKRILLAGWLLPSVDAFGLIDDAPPIFQSPFNQKSQSSICSLLVLYSSSLHCNFSTVHVAFTVFEIILIQLFIFKLKKKKLSVKKENLRLESVKFGIEVGSKFSLSYNYIIYLFFFFFFF
jgi:hypothetical protein